MTSATATQQSSNRKAFDPDLLDRMIGAKGNQLDLETRSQSLLAALGPVLSEAFHSATGVAIDARPGEIYLGRRRELLDKLSGDTVYCEASIANWSKEICSLCGTELIIGMVECLLGGSNPDELDVVARPLSGIELDMSLVVFEQLNDSLRGLVAAKPDARARANNPQPDYPEEEDDPIPNFHAVALTLDVEFGSVTAPLTLILPQAALIKTKLNKTKLDKKADGSKGDWTERLSDSVSKSQISLQAAVALKPLPLGEISRLQTGDLIAFAHGGDLEVTLSANGQPLYTCALGRAGSRYMVKIEGHAGPDENWKNDFG